jgi:hypothetical protein
VHDLGNGHRGHKCAGIKLLAARGTCRGGAGRKKNLQKFEKVKKKSKSKSKKSQNLHIKKQKNPKLHIKNLKKTTKNEKKS